MQICKEFCVWSINLMATRYPEQKNIFQKAWYYHTFIHNHVKRPLIPQFHHFSKRCLLLGIRGKCYLHRFCWKCSARHTWRMSNNKFNIFHGHTFPGTKLSICRSRTTQTAVIGRVCCQPFLQSPFLLEVWRGLKSWSRTWSLANPPVVWCQILVPR